MRINHSKQIFQITLNIIPNGQTITGVNLYAQPSTWKQDFLTYPHATTEPDGPYEQAITHVVGIDTACSYK